MGAALLGQGPGEQGSLFALGCHSTSRDRWWRHRYLAEGLGVLLMKAQLGCQDS